MTSITDPALRDAVRNYVYPRVATSNRTPCLMRASCREWYRHVELPVVRISSYEAVRTHVYEISNAAVGRAMRNTRVIKWNVTPQSTFQLTTEWHGKTPPAIHTIVVLDRRAGLAPSETSLTMMPMEGWLFLLLTKIMEPENGGEELKSLRVGGSEEKMDQLLGEKNRATFFADKLRRTRRLESFTFGPTGYPSEAPVTTNEPLMRSLAALPNLKRVALAIEPQKWTDQAAEVAIFERLSTWYRSLVEWLGKQATGVMEFSFYCPRWPSVWFLNVFVESIAENVDPGRAVRINFLSDDRRDRWLVENQRSDDERQVLPKDGIFRAMETALKTIPNLQLGIFFQDTDDALLRFAVPIEGEMRRRLRFQMIPRGSFFQPGYLDAVWENPDV